MTHLTDALPGGVHGSPGADTSAYSEPPVNPIRDETPSTPLKFQLYQNYPNPFNAQTTICFNIEKNTKVSLKIYHILGQAVSSLVHTTLQPGRYSIRWNASKFSTGIYFCQMRTKEFCQIKKFIILK